MANALGELFSDIAEAIRGKTGDTAAMKPAEFPERISGIEAGGSGENDYSAVHFVTFMSEDGTTELYKRPVADGDDCADPVVRGLLSEPTKESTAQYSYTHVGWSAEPSGALDENVLKAITEDKTVYANFASVLRYYTVTYYDSDGTTVLKTESLAYGATPSYVPTKSDYGFVGWNPEVSAVKGDTSYTAEWTEVITFANASWEQIAEISASGEASSRFAIGDTKTIALDFSGTVENLKISIIGFDHDDLADGSGKAGISIALIQCAASSVLGTTENSTYGTGYIWETSKTRTLLNSGAVYQALPSDLRSVIKAVTKTSNSGYGNDYNGGKSYGKNALYTTTDKVWMLSSTELGLDNAYSSSYVALGQGEQYEYFTGSAKRMLKGSGGTEYIYATRSMMTQYALSSVAVYTISGNASYGRLGQSASGNGTYPRIFGFCV